MTGIIPTHKDNLHLVSAIIANHIQYDCSWIIYEYLFVV